MLLTYGFAGVAVVLGCVLIGMGNTGGWVLLGLAVCIVGAVHIYVGSVRKRQPE
ncbi:hypothetical protein [Streptomyces sp. SID2999]|uniref:hypothetical protein n=1 Tax=Streptomyces TaxID=1883 RepID=UPI001F2F6A91|nr:hypothetical protein [Streptomyces sp. SID2999]